MGTETWLNSSLKSCEIFPANYTVFRKDRTDGYGGVLLAIKSLPAHHIDYLDVDAELIWVRIELVDRRPLFVGAYYNPNTSRESFAALDQSLAMINNSRIKPSTIWLAGDFNLRDIDWINLSVKPSSPIASQCKAFLDMCTNYHLQQLVLTPTRANNTLDLFLTTNPSQITSSDTLPGLGSSDHDIVRIVSVAQPKRNKIPKRDIYLYSKADLPALKASLSDFSIIFTCIT